jgi:hypothetical protein
MAAIANITQFASLATVIPIINASLPAYYHRPMGSIAITASVLSQVSVTLALV